MNTPTFNKGGWPTDETIQAIEKWVCGSFKDYRELWEFFVETFDENYGTLFQVTKEAPDNCTRAHGRAMTWVAEDDFDRHDIYYMATGGWSNNEAAVGALMGNRVFVMLCWLGNWRGGAYLFRIPKEKA